MRVYGSTFYNINPTKHYLKSNFKSAGASINNAFSFDRVEFCARPKNTDAMPVMTNDKSCSEQLFKVKNIKNLRCPVCRKIMPTFEQRQEIISDICGKSGQELIDVISKYYDDSALTGVKSDENQSIFRGQKQKIAQKIQQLAKQYPNYSIREIVNVYGLECLQRLIPKQLEVVDDILSYIETADLNILEKEELYEIIEIYSEQIKGASEERFFRKNFINDLKNADINKDIRKDIVEIVSNLPTSENNIDSFFVKYSGISSEEAIVTGLIANTAASAEHIIPKSRGGKNKLSNYMCDCADCNSTRRSSDFKNWDKEIPNFEENLQEYLDSVAKGVEDGTLNHWYIDYIENVAKTISFATDGKIELKVPSVDKDKICKWQPPQLTD